MSRQTELITALDVPTREEALAAVERCGRCAWFKVGLQLYTRYGPDIAHAVRQAGKQLFLDLKFHDIPNTVKHAVESSIALDAGLLTIHASGGRAMIAAAREAAEGTNTRILAVTVLTSISEAALRGEVGMPETPEQAVRRLASLAVDSGAHGIVCSPLEITAVREAVGPDALIVTPGIRPAWAAANDQARIMTPADARAAGADYIVVGRPILGHENPAEAVDLIQDELN
ncbi:MAG: orotidine-5'-phosphate decarboxylase [Candidatus Hydrogenedens sp.]|nr:orotidine-5'-phosphate decarboxylase [Candidatus Hydrogenedens sp.]